jgi:hypothetical protein
VDSPGSCERVAGAVADALGGARLLTSS